MNFKKSKEKIPILIDMTPLIDVVFLLLIFFMVSTTFVSAPGIKIDLPQASTEEIMRKKDDITIVLRQNQDIIVNQKKLSFSEMRGALEEISKKDPNSLVIIKADAGVTHGRVVEVMDAAKSAGLHQLAIATQPRG